MQRATRDSSLVFRIFIFRTFCGLCVFSAISLSGCATFTAAKPVQPSPGHPFFILDRSPAIGIKTLTVSHQSVQPKFRKTYFAAGNNNADMQSNASMTHNASQGEQIVSRFKMRQDYHMWKHMLKTMQPRVLQCAGLQYSLNKYESAMNHQPSVRKEGPYTITSYLSIPAKPSHDQVVLANSCWKSVHRQITTAINTPVSNDIQINGASMDSLPIRQKVVMHIADFWINIKNITKTCISANRDIRNTSPASAGSSENLFTTNSTSTIEGGCMSNRQLKSLKRGKTKIENEYAQTN